MNRKTQKKIILVTRPTRLADLVQRFNTVSQAKFYVEHLGADFSDYLAENETYVQAVKATEAALESLGRLQRLDRSFIPNFVFGPQDLVVVLGQDGLVANTLKYLDGQAVIGVNPDTSRWEGQLLPFLVRDVEKIVPEVFQNRRSSKAVTMAQATLNTGQSLLAVNDLFIGPRTHLSARYRIQCHGQSERHSSSGIIVSTGLGSTGWLRSLLTGASAVAAAAQAVQSGGEGAPMKKNQQPVPPPAIAWDADHLFFTVREPFPTRNTGASVVFGKVTQRDPLTLVSEMAENGVIFSDGIEKDFLEFNAGTQAVIAPAGRQGRLVV